jgi:UDP-2,3-diacylglucosamine pyrophosphatase LpxH
MNQYDELYVVSDLHFGGDRKDAIGRNFQIFDQGPQLAGLVDLIAQRQGRVALVLNGDIVDFLAETPRGYLDTSAGADKLRRIFDDGSFAMVWTALPGLVARAEKHLVLVLGNHDVELALPELREALLARLCGTNLEARARVQIAFDGAGFRCMVGNRSVLCVHGNEVDEFNPVDHLQLLQVCRALNRGNPPPDWDANFGTRLVVDVMNRIKRNFPFVDLLKPETAAAFPVLLAVVPEIKDDLARLAFNGRYLIRDTKRLRNGLLGVAEQDDVTIPASPEQALAAALLSTRVPDRKKSIDEVYEDLERDYEADLGAGTRKPEEGTLGIGGQLIARIMGSDPLESLRESLKENLQADRTFDPAWADSDYKKIDEIAASSIDYVIAGHTHLERAIKSPRRSGGYLNTGTWIRLMRIRPEWLESNEAFKPVYEALTHCRNMAEPRDGMKTLDDFKDAADNPLILRIPTVAVVRLEEGVTEGSLYHYRHAEGGGALEDRIAPQPPKE